MQSDQRYMQRCIQLAKLGQGKVAPNPLVGAVIVHNNQIIGEGYHEKYGKAHAEVNAVTAVQDKSLLPESTIYVSLEPCAHYGKTPPCATLLAEHNFERVVIGCTDSFSAVSGKGIEKLTASGINVTVGVLEDECRTLNHAFFTFHEKKRPYISLKWAQTKNGLIDNQNQLAGQISWISAPEVQTLVHKWRTEHMGILVGRKTIEHDNPRLTVRAVEGNNPTRIVLDSNCTLESGYSVFDDSATTLVINQRKNELIKNIEYIKVNDMTPQHILNAVYNKGIQSLLIEGGAQTLQSFIDDGLWDKACVIMGQGEFNKGTTAPIIGHTPIATNTFFGDTLKWYKNV